MAPPSHCLSCVEHRCLISGRGAVVALLLFVIVSSGCNTTVPRPWDTAEKRRDARLRNEDDDDKDVRRIDDVVGPLQRLALIGARKDQPATAEDRDDQVELRAAQKLFETGEYAAAEKRFDALARKRNPDTFRLFGKNKKQPQYDAIREEAVFYMAESEYMQKEFNHASQHYRQLIKDYPATRYMDESTRRLFDISKPWLGIDDFATTGEIRQVGLEDGDRKQPLSTEAGKSDRSWFPRFGDPTRPALDPSGHAVQCLQTIWLNDPTGPLADDALMLAATYYIRSERYQDADRLLTILREQFPKSPHLQTAFVLGSHVKLMSYQGSEYDEQKLDDAQSLKESTLRLFPDVPEADRLRRELKAIEEAQARRDWEVVELYERKRNKKAVAVYCREIIRNHPSTSYAERAEERLAELGQPAPTGGSPGSLLRQPVRKLAPYSPFRSEPAQRDEPAKLEKGADQVFPSESPIFDEPAGDASGASAGKVRL